MASPLFLSRRRQPASALSSPALKAREALVLEHLPLADAIASVMARRLFPLVEREDLIQVAREALVRSTPRCRASEPAASYLRRCIAGALQHRLCDRVPAFSQATALRLTVLEGLSLRAAAERLAISAMSVMRAQKKAIAALQQQLSGGG
jgi:DNA-directed RNA polymerase specialized sigma subunit